MKPPAGMRLHLRRVTPTHAVYDVKISRWRVWAEKLRLRWRRACCFFMGHKWPSSEERRSVSVWLCADCREPLR